MMNCFCCGPSRPKKPPVDPKPLPPVEIPKQTVQTTVVSDKQQFLLPNVPADRRPRKCLVLDLDETLVHSSFKPIPNADFRIEIELEGIIHRVYVRKRPGVDEFLKAVGGKFEVILFTASLSKYADPLLDILDQGRVIEARLFREACTQHYGNYVKDLTRLGRPIGSTLIIDNSPFAYMFQPDNAIPITSWFNDRNDRQLYDLLPFLDSLLTVDDLPALLSRTDFSFLTASSGMDEDSQIMVSQNDEEHQQQQQSQASPPQTQGGQGGQPLIWSVSPTTQNNQQ